MPRESFLAHGFWHGGKWERARDPPPISMRSSSFKARATSFSPHLERRGVMHHLGQGATAITAARVLQGHQNIEYIKKTSGQGVPHKNST